MSFWSRRKKEHPPANHQEAIVEDDAPLDAGSELYCRSDTVRFPLGHHSQLVYSKLSRTAHILPSHLLDLLDCCGTFKSLDEHEEDCYQYFHPGEAVNGSLEKLLRELVERGLLVSYSRLVELCRKPLEASDGSARISTVGVITRNRLESLKRCIVSYIENGKKYGRTHGFVVMDDSEDLHVRDEARGVLQSLAKSYGAALSYAGAEEKTRFADALVTSGGIPVDVVNFALFDPERCGYSVGANRNALLLHSVGEIIFSADDDTVCRLATAPEVKPGLAFDARGDFMKFWFFPDREAALRSVPPVEEDVLEGHEQLLGRSLSYCVSSLADPSRLLFDQIDSRQIAAIQSGRGRVMVTFNGLLGDSALPAPVGYLLLSADSRERLVRSRADYRSAFTSRELLRVTDGNYISANAWCVTAALGYDNRTLLPPFMPVLRGEDDLFGFTMRACFNDGYFGYLPSAILHAPPDRRAYSPGDLEEFASGVRMCNVILACINSLNAWPGLLDARERLHALGDHLTSVASLPRQDFEEFVLVHLYRMQSEYLSFLEGSLQAYEESPEFWARDVEKYLDAVREAIKRRDYVVPQDLLNGRGADEARQLSQRLVFRFGQLLRWWPEMVEAAKSLRAQGQSLARPL